MDRASAPEVGDVVATVHRGKSRKKLKMLMVYAAVLLIAAAAVYWFVFRPRILFNNALNHKDCKGASMVEAKYPDLRGKQKAQASSLVATCASKKIDETSIRKAVEWSKKAVADNNAIKDFENAKAYQSYIDEFEPLLKNAPATSSEPGKTSDGGLN
jgi:hypothetical protein